jgi:general stress protein 26
LKGIGDTSRRLRLISATLENNLVQRLLTIRSFREQELLMQNTANQDNNAQKVWDLIKDAHSALLVTVGPDGRLDSRPMGCVQTDFEGTIWFLTFADSSKVNEILKDDRVLVSYANAAKYEYVSLSGTARLVTDAEKLKELWSEALRVWFTSGREDPNLALLAVSVEEAKYWTDAASMVTYAWAYLKARFLGVSPNPDQISHSEHLKF